MGRDVQTFASEIKKSMGVVPQEDNLDPDLSVVDNLTMYAHYFDIPKKKPSCARRSFFHFFNSERNATRRSATSREG